MSVNWTSDHVGYDGDFLYARFAVDQWQTPEDFEKALDGYLGIVREQMLAEFKRLRASEETPMNAACACGEADCWYFDAGYPWCRSCREHHRPPECPVDEQGRSLAPDGEPWENQP